MASADISLLPFKADFENLSEVQNFLYTTLQELRKDSNWPTELKSGIISKLPNGRKIRLILPKGRDKTLQLLQESATEDSDVGESMRNPEELIFVGFFGFSKPREILTKEVFDKIWKADQILVDEFKNQKYLMAYVSAEQEIGGDWMNLVLCSSPQGITDWHNFEFHSDMASEISPEYYSRIRIHRGRLHKGLKSEKFTVYQTLFLAYGNDKEGSVKRLCRVWNTREEDKYFITDSS
ncbi:hypothetical protein LOTGIDRAFT_162330 [Lottia gigantea]|uniref:Uncharacterized protein n=1 Tax=Lottia gigantea TaxID=225164 RepID=V3ZNB4_LOTGI|nr:hypothetical protein LOTGIDRAFT_162330 [Lottia gigantea]ESO92853.1 hypothetical protein LOTGIDRAFT_162330 [Lottia gigantea]